MSHGVHNHGHHHAHGHHGAHGAHGHHEAKRASGEKKPPTAASTPAAQAGQAQQPSMDTAMAALDQAINSLAANFHKDSFNNQEAPAGLQAAPSTLTSPLANRTADSFVDATGGARAPTAQAAPAPAPATDVAATSNLNDPILNIRGGGGLAGGVLAGGGAGYLGQYGGGGLAGGVLPSNS